MHDCLNCYYRNSSWVGRVELGASCDHPSVLPEGKVLYADQLQSPDWCPLGDSRCEHQYLPDEDGTVYTCASSEGLRLTEFGWLCDTHRSA